MLLLFLAALAALSSAASASCTPALALIQSTPTLSVLSAALRLDPDLELTLGNASAVLTVFAPLDAAYNASFQRFDQPEAAFFSNVSLVHRVLRYQVVPGIALKPHTGGGRRVLPTLFPGKFLELQGLEVRSAGGSDARVVGQRDACAASLLLLDNIVLFS